MDLALSLGLVTFGLGLIGVFVTVYSDVAGRHRGIIVFAFSVLGLLGVYLTVIQSSRNTESQKKSEETQAKYREELAGLRGQLTTLSLMVGPAARADSRRIAEAVEKMAPQQVRSQITRITPVKTAVSRKQKLLTLSADVLGCVGERSAMEPVPSGSGEPAEYVAQQKYLQESTSICMSRLGARIFEAYSEAKTNGENSGDTVLFLAKAPSLHDLIAAARDFEVMANKLR